jgi:acetyl-CoA C-acetyltransferase
VATICWPYTDEAALIAAELGITPRETVRTSQFGGDGPGRLVSDTARAIAAGEVDVALLSGAEAVSALRAAQREQRSPAWTHQPADAKPTRTIGTDRFASNEAETAVGLLAPVYNYALLETAVQAKRGARRADHAEAIAELWSRFSAVAEGNANAWIRKAFTADELLERTPENRAVSEPYSKLLTANIQVDQATGLIMCSAQAARDAGVPIERWVFPLAGAYSADEWFLTERSELAESPAIAAAGTAALTHAGATIDEVAYVDLYSCFPSAVQIAADALGLDTAARAHAHGRADVRRRPREQLREPRDRDRCREAARGSGRARAEHRAWLVRHEARRPGLLRPTGRAAVLRIRCEPHGAAHAETCDRRVRRARHRRGVHDPVRPHRRTGSGDPRRPDA